MLMEVLGIILAFSTVMMIFGLLVTTAVQFVQNIGTWREKILEQCLEQFSQHLQDNLGGLKDSFNADVKQLLAPVSLNNDNKLNKYFFWRNYKHTNVSQEQIQSFFEENLQSEKLESRYQKAEIIRKHRMLLNQKFAQFEQEMTAVFTRRTHYYSFVFALAFAISFQLNTFDLLSRLSMDEGFRNELILVAEQAVANDAGPCKKIGENYTFEVKSANAIDKFTASSTDNVKVSKLAKIKENQYSNFESLKVAIDNNFSKELSVPVYAELKSFIDTQSLEHKNMVESCFQSNAQSISKLGFKIMPNGHQYYLKGHAYSAEVNVCLSFLQAWLGMIISAILISLGGPFWFDRIKDLVKLRESVKPKK